MIILTIAVYGELIGVTMTTMTQNHPVVAPHHRDRESLHRRQNLVLNVHPPNLRKAEVAITTGKRPLLSLGKIGTRVLVADLAAVPAMKLLLVAIQMLLMLLGKMMNLR